MVDIVLGLGDTLLAIDVQQDFLPLGTLPVPQDDQVIPVLNDYIHAFAARVLPVYATRDWHPPHHGSI